MEPRRLHALLLRCRPLGESDLLLDFFSRELGRITAVAKGAKRSKRRFFGLLEIAHFLEIEVEPGKRGDLWLLLAARLTNPHLGLRQDWRRLLLAGPVLELLLRASAPHDPQPGALQLALDTLARLERGRGASESAAALAVFLLRLLNELGFAPRLEACLHCAKPAAQINEPRLSLDGGLVCPTCPPGRKAVAAPPGLVAFLRAAQTMEPAALGRLRLSPALARPGLVYLADFWREISGHDLPALGLALDYGVI